MNPSLTQASGGSRRPWTERAELSQLIAPALTGTWFCRRPEAAAEEPVRAGVASLGDLSSAPSLMSPSRIRVFTVARRTPSRSDISNVVNPE